MPFLPEAVQEPGAMQDSCDSSVPMADTAAYGVTLATVLPRMLGGH